LRNGLPLYPAWGDRPAGIVNDRIERFFWEDAAQRAGDAIVAAAD
jgi:hypothetical protein